MNDKLNHFQTLMHQLRSGSQDAARQLTEEYGAAVLRYVRKKLGDSLRPRFDSIDFVQQVWASVFTDPAALAGLETPDQFSRWLQTLAHNKVADVGRTVQTQKRDHTREVRIDEHAEIAGPHPASREPTPSAVAAFNDERERLLDNLPPRVRQVFELRMQGMTYDEIATELEVDEKTARLWMKPLRRKLQLQGDGAEGEL